MTKRIVALLGDYYHDAELSKNALQLAVQQINDVEVEYRTVQELNSCLKQAPDAVVLFAENRLNPQDEIINTWMDEQIAKNISQYVRSGGGWLAWHSGLAGYEIAEEYIEMTHGYFEYHPKQHEMVTYSFDQNNEFFQKGELAFLDEHYFVKCDEEKTNVFLTSTSVDGKSIAGWHHQFGNGRVVCLTPAHLKEGLEHPVLVQLLADSLKRIIS
ncbi:ThuA domain-containing protein [Metabacillus niabensis]|uniref:Type 1 glutamine amidotransferase n=1 Tax=Metabacillus niabensis TaxID=324854 RepID=A0ABT9YXH0_9BACI|nr:ThuA domain-containing protein [Metabacillus niabensis]MDQ0224301.1 type 1 glutamine amidotransferase [Metabacillus niabensis]